MEMKKYTYLTVPGSTFSVHAWLGRGMGEPVMSS